MTREEYLEKLNLQKQLNNEIIGEIQTLNITNDILDEIIAKVSDVIEKPVFDVFYWNTGKLFGLMNSIVMNRKQRQELMLITGLTTAQIDLWAKYSGIVPYYNDKGLNIGKPMDIVKIKQLIPIIANTLGIIVEPDDLCDITQERWDRIYSSALESAMKTAEFEKNKNVEEYEE